MSTSCSKRKPPSNTITPNRFYGPTANEHTPNEHKALGAGEDPPDTLIQETNTKAPGNCLKRKAPRDMPSESYRNVKCRTDSISRGENMFRRRYHRDDHEPPTDLQLQEKADKRSTTHYTPLGTNPRPQPLETRTNHRACKRKATVAEESPTRKRGRYLISRGDERPKPMSHRPRTIKPTQPLITSMLRPVKGNVARPPNNTRDRPNARAPESPLQPPRLPPTTEETIRTLPLPETVLLLAILNVMEIYKLDSGRVEEVLTSMLSKEVLRLRVGTDDVMAVVSTKSSYMQGMLKIGRW